jgi:hypothetical protein
MSFNSDSSNDLQTLADVEGEFILDDRLFEGVRGYHSNSNPPRLALRLEESANPEEFLASIQEITDKYLIIETIEILAEDCA